MHLLFLSPDWFIFCDMIISLLYKFTRVFFFVFLFILCFSLTKGQCSKRQTILYQPFYISICVSTLPHYVYFTFGIRLCFSQYGQYSLTFRALTLRQRVFKQVLFPCLSLLCLRSTLRLFHLSLLLGVSRNQSICEDLWNSWCLCLGFNLFMVSLT